MLNKIGILGIFIICAQAVIHFSPSQSYTKYLKLIFSLMILVQLLQPLMTFIGGNNEFMRQWTEDLSMYVGEVKEDFVADMGYEEQIARIVDYGLREYAQVYESRYADGMGPDAVLQTSDTANILLEEEETGYQENSVQEQGSARVQVHVEEIPVITIDTGERNDS